ncbi:MAG TPA: M13-type metalloendopeptidase [Nocardioides sp.]|uniref:M13 family metallopeptidase n=1 Tax=Nocardioides sp. TaxID=35761 RepID=UPI002D80C7E5|nr:M13-type metalloendopeptidase [Nocardioides sp.]HET6651776.1 M13-type metalloendopeptidase [Nocardioides sp.]
MLDDARPGMNPDIRPQDDLFGHVNGRWLDETEIPSDRSSWGSFTVLADAAEEHVRQIIEELAQSTHEPGSNAQKIGDLYASFMDEERVEALGAEPIRADLDRLGTITDTSALAAFMGALERQGGGGFFAAYVDTDDRNSDRYIVNVLQGGLGLPDESYYREEKFAEVRTKYLAHLERMFELAGVDDPAGAAERVLSVERRLAEGHWERAATRDVLKTYNLRTLADLKQAAPAFDWDAWATALGADEATLAEVCVRQPSYFEHLSTVLEEVSLEDWKAWAAIRVIRSASSYLSAAFVDESFDFYGKTLNGTPELRARWKRGVAFVEGAIGEAVGEEYVARHFPPRAKEMMDELVANLIEAYRRQIAALDWMGEETKQRAFRKLETFRPKIGYPEKFRDYSALEVTAGDLIGNARAAAAFETNRELGKIGSPVDRDEWFMLPQTVNAYYNPGTNEICFPAGILQKPFFDADAEPAENYGGIGAVIGHEVGHGFDDQGSQFDEVGNLNEWWTEADRAAFKARSDKLIAQYDGYEPRDLPGEKVNGALTVGENIGDLGGITIGLKAYEISLEGQEAPVVDGLTGVQRVFLNYAHVWRTKRRKEQLLQLLTTDPHSPGEFRANIVRNLDEFHEAFGTKPGDGLWLDPEDRVRIW